MHMFALYLLPDGKKIILRAGGGRESALPLLPAGET